METVNSLDQLDQLVRPSLAQAEPGLIEEPVKRKPGRPRLAPGEKGKPRAKKTSTPRKPRPSELAKKVAQPPKLTGGLTSYYLVEVTHPQRENQAPYVAECEDVGEALQLTPDEMNIFKEIWRSARQRQGTGKPGHSLLYGAEKIVHYANRILRRIKRSV